MSLFAPSVKMKFRNPFLEVGQLPVIRGARILDQVREEFVGDLLWEDGKILAVGEAPPAAEEMDGRGLTLSPGLIDAHSHLAVFSEPWIWANLDGNEFSDPVTPHLRAIDALNPLDPALPDVLAAGITTVYTGPGSANLIGGTGLAVKLTGRTPEEMALPGSEGMKFALGENPKRVYGEDRKRFPYTRMGSAAGIREALLRSRDYLERKAEAEKEGKAFERDLRWEALGRVLRREIPARIHAHRADDILTALRLAEEFDFRLVVEHATEGYLVADVLAERDVPCTVGPILLGREKWELFRVRTDNAARLAAAGVRVAIQSDGGGETRFLPLHAAVAARDGLGREAALRAITREAAGILGLSDRLGTLEPGKDADFVLWEGHPLAVESRVRAVYIGGRRVFGSVD